MLIASHVPAPPLNAFAENFWYHEGLTLPHSRERVLPDGTFELIINLRDERRHLFPRNGSGAPRDFRRAWISGTHSEFIIIDTVPNASLIGVHFRPGGAAAFLGMPASELRDRVVELDSLWGGAVHLARERLLAAERPEEKFRILEQFLLDHARNGLQRDAVVRHALWRFARAPHMSTIDEVAREVGLCHKHFIARFRAEIGITPKRFCRITRFHEILRTIQHQDRVEWADLAVAGGYFDQSHFIQEFRGFAGINPSEYLRDRSEYPKFVPLSGGARH